MSQSDPQKEGKKGRKKEPLVSIGFSNLKKNQTATLLSSVKCK